MRGTSGGVTTRYIGSYYEWTSAGSTNYYSAGSTRIAERRTGYGSNNGLFWLTGDHLGSTSVTANSSGTKVAEVRYKPWGEDRYTSGTTLTTYRYTGQRVETSFGLYYYGARWYDSSLNRWTQPDSIVPLATQGVQAYDRYAYVNNNPVKYNDPSGHCFGPLLVICIAAADLLVEAAPVIIAGVATAYALASDSHYQEETAEEKKVGITVVLGIVATVASAAIAAAPYTTGGVDASSYAAEVQASESTGADAPTFRTPELLTEHFGDHAGEFGYTTEAEYLRGAQDFIGTQGSEGVQFKVRASDGSTVIFNQETNEFAVVAPDGYIRTYFKPDPARHDYETNQDYYDSQK